MRGMRRNTSRDAIFQGQLLLPFGPIRNMEFLSSHWLEHRLPWSRNGALFKITPKLRQKSSLHYGASRRAGSKSTAMKPGLSKSLSNRSSRLSAGT